MPEMLLIFVMASAASVYIPQVLGSVGSALQPVFRFTGVLSTIIPLLFLRGPHKTHWGRSFNSCGMFSKDMFCVSNFYAPHCWPRMAAGLFLLVIEKATHLRAALGITRRPISAQTDILLLFRNNVLHRKPWYWVFYIVDVFPLKRFFDPHLCPVLFSVSGHTSPPAPSVMLLQHQRVLSLLLAAYLVTIGISYLVYPVCRYEYASSDTHAGHLPALDRLPHAASGQRNNLERLFDCEQFCFDHSITSF